MRGALCYWQATRKQLSTKMWYQGALQPDDEEAHGPGCMYMKKYIAKTHDIGHALIPCKACLIGDLLHTVVPPHQPQ